MLVSAPYAWRATAESAVSEPCDPAPTRRTPRLLWMVETGAIRKNASVNAGAAPRANRADPPLRFLLEVIARLFQIVRIASVIKVDLLFLGLTI
jgi:hypothetical protein